mgnify:CR=1 FL=1
MFNFVWIKGVPLDVQFSYQNMYTFNRVMIAPLKLTSDKLKRQASRRNNMKEYKAVIKTTQEWTKDIKIPDDVEDIRDYVNDHFHETHYKNFDDSWKNNLVVPEEYEIIDIQASEQKG